MLPVTSSHALSVPTNEFEGSDQLTDNMIKSLEKNNPSLVHTENSGYCQLYTGKACAKYIKNNYVYFSD